MSNQIKNGLKNDSVEERKSNMDTSTKLIKTFIRLFEFKSIALLFLLFAGAYTIMLILFPMYGDKIFGSFIVAVALTFIIKYFEYYD